MPTATAQPADKRVELVLHQLEELPTLPTIAVKVLEITGSDTSDAKEVVDLISADPVLSTRILQLVHRVDSGVRGEITSVERAVVMLGFEAVRSAVLAVTIFKSFDNSRNDFWKHSVAVATACEMLAESLQASMGTNLGFDPSEAFVAGLLHDLGKIALDVMLPKSFTKIVEASEMLHGNIADIERQVVGLDHMVIGKRLAERWQLPQQIRECIWLHNQSPEALPKTVKNARLINLVTLADMIARQQHLGYSGNFTFNIPQQSLLDGIGISQQQLDEIFKNLVSRIAPRAEGLGLDQASSHQIYSDALTQANRQLGKISTQLAMKSRKLNIRAKLFDALNQFHSELKPDAPTQLVVQAIGQTAVGVLGAKSLVAFSLAPKSDTADATRFDEAGQAVENYALHATVHPKKPSEAIAPASDELEWLLAEVSPKFDGPKRHWIALHSDGNVIGGIVWGGTDNEIDRLSPQIKEIAAVAGGWSLALRTSQIRDESRLLAEQLADANRQLQDAQAEALKTRTMVSVGEMAAGAAHEMNNPLMVISGRAQLLAQQLTGPQLKDAAQQIADQASQLSEIITELMAFAKPAPPHPADALAGAIVDRALTLVKQRGEIGQRKIDVQKETVPAIHVDSGQIEMAVAEVIDNAIKATDEKKGQITITSNYDVYSERVVITIADNGIGMDDKTLKRAFDPFFSAKSAGRRRGMGLAKAMRYIESSGGSIRLDSRQGQGTRAVILLPAAKTAQQKSPPSRKAAT